MVWDHFGNHAVTFIRCLVRGNERDVNIMKQRVLDITRRKVFSAIHRLTILLARDKYECLQYYQLALAQRLQMSTIRSWPPLSNDDILTAFDDRSVFIT